MKKGVLRCDAIVDEPAPQPEGEDANFVQQGGKWQPNKGNKWQRGQGGQGGSNYQGGLKKPYFPNNQSHPNFSYANPNNAVQPPPGFLVENGVIQEPKKELTMEEMMKNYYSTSEARMRNSELQNSTINNTLTNLSKQMQMLENQMGQLANAQAGIHKSGQFSSTTEQNPKNHQCHAIELWSGTRYINPSLEVEDLGDGSHTDSETEATRRSSLRETHLDRHLDREAGQEDSTRK